MTKNPKRIVSAFLIILYSFIGLTGESAHYCFQQFFSSDAAFAASNGKSTETPTQAFHHRHAPGDHWHYHPVEKEHPVEQEQADPRGETAPRGPLFASSTNFHNDHACPLLSILRLLELGSGGQASLFSRLSLASELAVQEQPSFSLQVWSHHRVRGPPLRTLA